jgi:hypothetical protein
VTPELKALEVRLSALEQKSDLKFKHIEEKIESLEKRMDFKFATQEQRMDLKFDIVAATMAANQSAIMHALDIERRIERLESDRASGRELDRPA